MARPALAKAPATVSLGTGVVYTADDGDRSVSAVDLKTGGVHTVAVGIAPHNVQISATGRWLYAVGSREHMAAQENGMGAMAHNAGSGHLLVLDARRPDLSLVADIPIGPHPAHVVADAAERRAFVTDGERNALLVVSLPQRKVIASIPTGAFPHGLRMSPDGFRVYVANVNDNSVSVISTKTLKETARIAVGRAPVQVAVSPNGRRLYVSLRDEDRLAVVDIARHKVIASPRVGRGPIQVYITPNGRTVLAANQGTVEKPDRTISLLDTQTNTIVKTLTAGRGAHGVVVSADGKRAYVSNTFDNTVSVIDVPNRRTIRNIPVGEAPNGITYQRPRR